MNKPILWFFVLLTTSTVHHCAPEHWPPAAAVREVEPFYQLGFAILAGWFIMVDPQNKKAGWPCDHVAIFSGVLFPLYLLTTRKWKGLLILCALVAALALSMALPSFLR